MSEVLPSTNSWNMLTNRLASQYTIPIGYFHVSIISNMSRIQYETYLSTSAKLTVSSG